MMRMSLTLGVLSFALLAGPAAAADGIPVGGRVLLPWGEPLAEADLRLDTLSPPLERIRAQLADEPAEPAARARSDAQGRFRIDAPHAGLWVLRVEAPGFVPLEFELKPLIEPLELPDATMETDSGLTATVSGSGGEPLAGARVMVRTLGKRFAFLEPAGWKLARRIAETGEDGKVRLARGESERVNVTASYSGFLLGERRGRQGGRRCLARSRRAGPSDRNDRRSWACGRGPRRLPADGVLVARTRRETVDDATRGLGLEEGRAELAAPSRPDRGQRPLDRCRDAASDRGRRRVGRWEPDRGLHHR
jgi:hypothetical protein